MNLLLSIFLVFSNIPELIIGREIVDPGIVFIFEGAIKDEIYPKKIKFIPKRQILNLLKDKFSPKKINFSSP